MGVKVGHEGEVKVDHDGGKVKVGHGGGHGRESR